MDSRAKAKEANGAEDNDDEDEQESEFGLVDAVVFLCQVHADPVIERA